MQLAKARISVSQRDLGHSDHSGAESGRGFRDSYFRDKSDRMRAARPESSSLIALTNLTSGRRVFPWKPVERTARGGPGPYPRSNYPYIGGALKQKRSSSMAPVRRF